MFKMSKTITALVCAASLFCGTALARERAADFGVIDAKGDHVRLSDFAGTPVIVNFWATWCPPCLRELPAFDKVAAEYDGKIRFMMVDLTDGRSETVEGAKAFAAEHGYSFPLFFDTMGEGAEAYGVRAIPTTVVITADGEIEQTHVGSMDEQTLRGYVERVAGGR